MGEQGDLCSHPAYAPPAIGATETVAVCGKNIRSKAVCRYMGGKEVADGLFRFTSEDMLRRAEEIERAEYLRSLFF